MSLNNARTIGAVRARSKNNSGEPPKPRFYVMDYLEKSTMDMIWGWYKEGVTRRQMIAMLLEMGIPSPPTTVPWSDHIIATVVKLYKDKEGVQ